MKSPSPLKSMISSVTAAISPYRSVRDEVRGWVENFVEIHVATSLADCESRDVKGLYAKARAGEIPEFTGVSDPYEPPEKPEITLETVDALKPALLRSIDVGEFLYLLMPVRVS